VRMVRIFRSVLVASVVLGVIGAPTGALGAAPVACEGTVELTGTSNLEVRVAGPQVFVEFDFIGLHDICLADGSVVTGSVSGHLVQRTSISGDMNLSFDEVLSYGGGTLGYRGEASLTGGKWRSNVQTVGAGSGPLAGIHGQGEFWSTGATSLADVIFYVYSG